MALELVLRHADGVIVVLIHAADAELTVGISAGRVGVVTANLDIGPADGVAGDVLHLTGDGVGGQGGEGDVGLGGLVLGHAGLCLSVLVAQGRDIHGVGAFRQIIQLVVAFSVGGCVELAAVDRHGGTCHGFAFGRHFTADVAFMVFADDDVFQIKAEVGIGRALEEAEIVVAVLADHRQVGAQRVSIVATDEEVVDAVLLGNLLSLAESDGQLLGHLLVVRTGQEGDLIVLVFL